MIYPNPKARDVDNTHSSEHRSSQGTPDDNETARYLASYIAEWYDDNKINEELDSEILYRIIKDFYENMP